MDSLFWLCRVSSMLWPFRLDDNLSPRGNVEGCHSGLAYVLNCLLLAGECSSKCLGLPICVLGGFV